LFSAFILLHPPPPRSSSLSLHDALPILIAPDRQLAWQILALNTEKAHNLKERSLEVARIYRGLIDEDDSRKETDFAFYLEEAALDRKSTRLNSSHQIISYAVFCLKKKKK